MVEDSPSDAAIVREYLKLAREQDNIETELQICDSVKDAVEWLKNRPFDVVLLDLHLRDVSGLESLNTVLPVAGKIPVVVLSGAMSDLEMVASCLEHGAADALDKNRINEHSLVRTIAKVIMRQDNWDDQLMSFRQKVLATVAQMDAIRKKT